MESDLYSIYTLVDFVSEISLVCCAHSLISDKGSGWGKLTTDKWLKL